MQHEMAAGSNGTVLRLMVKPGDQVATRQLLVEIKPTGEARTSVRRSRPIVFRFKVDPAKGRRTQW